MTSVTTLDVLLYGELIGTITDVGSDRSLFAFTEEYIQDRNRAILSLSFKDHLGELLTEFKTFQTKLMPFFSNLLPEEALRTYLADRAGVNPEREFFLLWVLGQDLPGAISVKPAAGEALPPSVHESPEASLGREKVMRFSLAGVQLKFSAIKQAGGGLTVPVDGAGGSWIVKLPWSAHEGVPENEFSMMALARDVGIDVPENKLIAVDDIENIPEGVGKYGNTAYAIRRFDRAEDGSFIHMEDFAQVFGVYPADKYKKASMRNIAQVIGIEGREHDAVELVRRLVFNALIGNADMHLKNWSLIYNNPRMASLAPAYDFVSTIPYIADNEMALKVSRSKKFSDFSIDELKHLAAKAKLPEKVVLDTANETVERFHEVWRKEKYNLPHGENVVDAIDQHLNAVPIAKSQTRLKCMEDRMFLNEVNKRRTFAIISHPDAGKTTITEKLLLYGNQIQMAGTVKGKKSGRHATSDWMEMEKERGISVTTSVMQFPYRHAMVNLLDTPGHADFSEDTYRTLTAVDSALMVIDCAKGVEERTIKLMEVCRLRDTPILTFINKLDRDVREPIEVLDEIEDVLKIECAPVTWPIGMGKSFKGVYNLLKDVTVLYKTGQGHTIQEVRAIEGLHNPELDAAVGADYAQELRDTLELVQGASHEFDLERFLQGKLTPVFFGTALGNFGVDHMLDGLVDWAPAPLPRHANERDVAATEEKFTGFVFKIQANMDPRHRDRIAFMRICSGKYQKGIKLKQCRTGKDVRLADALTFLAGERENVEEAFAGDIIGLHNHGTIQIGDTFTEGEQLQFTGIPHFAPELFRRVVLRDPLKSKQLHKGLTQLAEEGATQVFFPLRNNDVILGAVGMLQFDVVAHRLKHEYGVECAYDAISVATARWTEADNERDLEKFRDKAYDNLAIDGAGHLTYLAPTRVNLQLATERHPEIRFRETREI